MSVVIGDDAGVIRTDRGGPSDGGCDETTRIVLGARAPSFNWGRNASCARSGGVRIDVDVAAREGGPTEREREIGEDDGDAEER